jgi:hypothetical protein
VLLALLPLLAVCALLGSPAPRALAARARSPTPTPADAVIAGPSAAITTVDGLSLARDGTGGLVFTERVGGVAHVFVSRLTGGQFQTPIEIDSQFAGPSSQPVIAAGLGGVLLVAFVNNGELWVVSAASSSSAFSAPGFILAGAANPAISMSNFGKAYLAFADSDRSGSDVRSAFYYRGHWGLEPTPLNVTADDDAGTGAGRPAVIAAGDGTGIVAWGEGGHVYTRRVVGTTPSVVYERADVAALNGWQEVSADEPAISAGGDSSYASVAFEEQLASGGSQQSRVLFNRLHGSQYDGVEQSDGLTTGGEGAAQPQTAVTEYGAGWVTSEHSQSHQLFATVIASGEVAKTSERVDSLTNAAAPDAVPAIAGLTSTLIAWQQTPGIGGPAEIRLRYAPNGSDLGAEQVISSPMLGAADADSGLVAAGDVQGDAAVAWVQGSGAGTRVVASQLYQPPGSFSMTRLAYARNARPIIRWSAANELWGVPAYTIDVDGTAVTRTRGLSYRPPAALGQGRHTFQITAVNQAGVSTSTNPATVFVDTIPPQVTVRVHGHLYVHDVIHLSVSATDAPAGLVTPAQASGIAQIVVKFGDHSSYVVKRGKYHAYARTGRYTITVTATDRAGNHTTVRERIRITKKPNKKHGKGSGGGGATG